MKTRQSPRIPLLLMEISLKPKPRALKKTNTIKKIVKDAIQLLWFISLKLLKRKKTKTRRTFAISGVIPINKKITILINMLKSHKISNNLVNFHVDNWEQKTRISMGTLHLVSHNLQKLTRGLIGLKKQSQYNNPGFCLLIKA